MNDTTDKATTVLLGVNSNQGYAPDQITSRLTLGELLAAVEEAIEEFGEEALIVTHDNGNRYGANFGSIAGGQWEPMFTAADPDGDDDEDGE